MGAWIVPSDPSAPPAAGYRSERGAVVALGEPFIGSGRRLRPSRGSR